jgi:hypothetical protein
MTDSNHQKLKEFFVKNKNVTLMDDSQAEHCGVHYFNFRAKKAGLKDICRRALKSNSYVQVYLDGWNEISYRIGIGCTHYDVDMFLEDERSGAV